ncbi:unnamed protein product [Amoebophrya sp. A120]|nr:unnamed protein product [Amoebophrya sp. A120]|eukprot:GSA120T00008926001.1
MTTSIARKLPAVLLLLLLGGGWVFLYQQRGRQLPLAMSGAYQIGVTLLTTVLPEKNIYTQAKMLETLHRTRYLTDALLAPVLVWSICWGLLLRVPFLVLLVLPLAGYHLLVTLAAWRELGSYPFTPELVLDGILYWKPARATVPMLQYVRAIDKGLRACLLAGVVLKLVFSASTAISWTAIFLLAVLCLLHKAVFLMRRGTDNEFRWIFRETVWLGMVAMVKFGEVEL